MHMTQMIGRLTAGPLDVVGDIHGELEALQNLLSHLGYDPDGRHSEGRHLVFVGDLVDRGPDSPAVVQRVRGLVESGAAQMVLGNHELNLLRGEFKSGNGWFYGDAAHRDNRRGEFRSSAAASAADRKAFLGFFSQRPVALERGDLRVVHACWHPQALARLTGVTVGPGPSFQRFEADIHRRLVDEGIEVDAADEAARAGAWLNESDATPHPLPAVARRDAYKQMGNPLRVLTSGIERETLKPFFSSGQWRFVERVRWWDEYQEPVPVIIGHYWRWAAPVDREAMGKGGPDLFDGLGTSEWHGARRNVFCVDYSVGRRYLDREQRRPYSRACRLGALRWPEQVIVMDDGERLPAARRPHRRRRQGGHSPKSSSCTAGSVSITGRVCLRYARMASSRVFKGSPTGAFWSGVHSVKRWLDSRSSSTSRV